MRALLSCFLTFSRKLISKLSPLVIGEILRVVVNTLTLNDKYRDQDSEKLSFPIQMQLSEKSETLPKFSLPFLDSTSNFKHFEIKDHR